MAWKYVNPGTYRLLDNYVAANCVNIADASISPHTGISFNNRTSSLADTIIIPDGTKELWVRADVLLKYYGTGGAGAMQFNGTGMTKKWDGFYAVVNDRSQGKVFARSSDATREMYMHIRSDATAGLFELYIDGDQVYSYSGAVNSGNDLKLTSFYNDSTDGVYSNLIIQDYELPKSENIAVLTPTIEDSTGWTASGGTYTTSSADRTLWQSFDLSGIAGETITSFGIYPAANIGDPTLIDAIRLKMRSGSSGSGTTVGTSDDRFSPVLTNPVAGRAWQKSDFSTLQVGLETIKT